MKELTALAATELVVAGKRKAARYFLYALAAFLVVGSLGFALGGLHTILAMEYGQIVASFSISGGLLLFALIVFLVARYWRPRPRTGEMVATAALLAAPSAARLLTPGAAKGAAALGTFALAAFLGKKLTH